VKAGARPFKPDSREKLFPEQGHDPYKRQAKLREPTVCPVCGAVYREGRWQWAARVSGAEEVVCSACHRIADGMPAGYLYIEGAFDSHDRVELLQLLRHHETRARSEHPMERIITIDERFERTVVTTTGIHLARELGAALERAFHGCLELKFSKAENLLRAYWQSGMAS
jgi:hypothetical protein